MKTTSRAIISAILFLATTLCAFALDIKGVLPTVSGGGNPSENDIQTAFDKILGDLSQIDGKPEKLITAFGSSQVFASSGAATQRGYGDYKVFCFTLSPVSLGLQLPIGPFEIIPQLNDPQKLLDKQLDQLMSDKDIKLGLSPQAINARIGINASKFLVKNLYLGLHVGYIPNSLFAQFGLEDPSISIDILSLGATANYQLIPSKKIAGGLLLWRGVNVGAGFIYSGTKIGLSTSYPGELPDVAIGTTPGPSLAISDPTISLDMKIDTYTIPIEVTTGVKLLWFLNIPLGIGMDIGFGTSDVKLGVRGDLNLKGVTGTTTPGWISATAGGVMSPTAFNLKAMTGVGINLGPVIVDVPITWYFQDNGLSVGLSIGAVW